jgi:hypothetical protein
MRKILFLYLGGAYQVFHTAAVAAELSQLDDFQVHCLAFSRESHATLCRILQHYPHKALTHSLADCSTGLAGFLAGLSGRSRMKKLCLLFHLNEIRGHDAILTPERTSTILKRFRLDPALFIHIPHGAGDRRQGFEERIGLFDFVIASGQKDADRMIREGLVTGASVGVSGSVKLATVMKVAAGGQRLFANDRPIVLYNPHFDCELGSWHRWGEAVVAALAEIDDFNLIVAPHVRLFEKAPRSELDRFERLSIPGKILVDAGSDRSCDMTYTTAADIYLGDTSSQVYEFIARPRPCVFLNAHGVDWAGDQNYAFWRFGDVVEDPSRIGAVVRVAASRHAQYIDLQERAAVAAMGKDWESAPAIAARLVADFMRSRPAGTIRDRA